MPIFNSNINVVSVKKRHVIQFIYVVLISIAIGLTTSILMGGSIIRPIEAYLWNAGYSISLGIPLFLNGFVFEKIAVRFIDWVNKPVKSLFAALSLHLIYTSIVIFTVNWFWFIVILKQDWENFWVSNRGTIISEYIIFIIIASIIYAMSFFKAWRTQFQETEKVKSEALALKYKVLQDQINPHFLFNSLNVLGSLIDTDTSKAKEFTRELSHFYRDVLYFKDQDIISLKEEIDFVKKYVYLQQIRFGEALEVEIFANAKVEGKVIPLSLQALVENAIKHNEISKASPLKIMIAISDDHELIVENNIQSKKVLGATSKTGLKNLAGRYEFLTGRKMIITQNDHYFRVILPLIMLED